MIVAVTGGIGSGKSSVCKALAEILSAPIISADTICRELLSINGKGWVKMRSVFGKEFFLSDGQLDRPILRKQLFSNDHLRQQLDDMLHPMVRNEIADAAVAAEKHKSILLVEVPLLFEKGWQDDFDWTVLVYADRETCVNRIMKRDSVSAHDAGQIIDIQMEMTEKIGLADTIIHNNESFLETRKQLELLGQILLKKDSF